MVEAVELVEAVGFVFARWRLGYEDCSCCSSASKRASMLSSRCLVLLIHANSKIIRALFLLRSKSPVLIDLYPQCCSGDKFCPPADHHCEP